MDSIDSLEPSYPCPAAQKLFTNSQRNASWTAHLERTRALFDALDAISGVSPDADDWHKSYDHYFDNLSSRLCHAKPLPCKVGDSASCVTQSQADKVFRLGQFEYSYMYRDSPTSLAASSASFGVWIGELAQHLRDKVTGMGEDVIYRHNIAHDGSLSRLLSILQVDVMVWPGMGSEVIFELYRLQNNNRKDGYQFFVRVLWGGQVMRSSNPFLGVLDLIPVDHLLAYFDALMGEGARRVIDLCGS
jgi:2-phosphoxylose phosphatase